MSDDHGLTAYRAYMQAHRLAQELVRFDTLARYSNGPHMAEYHRADVWKAFDALARELEVFGRRPVEPAAPFAIVQTEERA